MDGLLIKEMSADSLREMIRSLIIECFGSASADAWAGVDTVSLADIRDRFGMSKAAFLRGMKEGRYPQPVESHTREYRFNAEAVLAAFRAEQSADRSLRIRPDKRRVQRKACARGCEAI